MEYIEAVEQAGMLANRTGQSVFVVGWCDDYAVMSYKPKPVGGHTLREVLPSARKVILLGD